MSVFNAFCTTVTPNYAPYACALHESLENNSGGRQVHMFVFISSYKSLVEEHLPGKVGLHYLFMDDLCEDGYGKILKDKYEKVDVNAFRWSMKAVLIKHLLDNMDVDKAICLDGDIFFYSDFQFLFDKLDNAKVLLSPHWRSKDPFKDAFNFRQLLNRGIYNAGFVAVNKGADAILDWWLNMCLYTCTIEPENGFYGDQTYLNLFPVYFEGIEVLRHRGCNVANWNKIECRRVLRFDNSVWINDEYPIVFIHFTANTIRGILEGNDSLLLPNLELYAGTLKKYAPALDIKSIYKRKSERSTPVRTTIKKILRKFSGNR